MIVDKVQSAKCEVQNLSHVVAQANVVPSVISASPSVIPAQAGTQMQSAKRKVRSAQHIFSPAKPVLGKFSIFNFQFSILLLLSTLLLQGCLTHWIVDGEVRMQIENRSDVAIAAFSVVDKMGNRSVWVPDTLWPGEKSQVYADEWVGNFRLGLSARDSVDAQGDSCWRFVELGAFDLEGGSSLAQIRRSAGVWSLEVK